MSRTKGIQDDRLTPIGRFTLTLTLQVIML